MDFPKIKVIQLDLKNNLDLKEKFPKLSNRARWHRYIN